MQKAKRLLFVASIFELVLAGLYLIIDIIYSSKWLSSIEGNLTINIVITVSLFVMAILLAVDGVLTLRYAKAEDEIAKKCQKARLFAASVFIVLTVAAFIINWCIEENDSMMLIDLITFLSFAIFIVLTVLNFKGSFAMNQEQEIQPQKIEPAKPVQKSTKKEEEIDSLIEKLSSLSILKERGLITEEEFEKLRKQILNAYKK